MRGQLVRLVAVAALVATFLVAGTAEAWADGLAEDLTRAGEAEFSARRLVVCSTPEGVVSSTVDVQQADGTLVIRHGDSPAEMIVGKGEIATGVGDGPITVTRVLTDAEWRLSSRYEVVEVGSGQHLGRPVDVVEVRDDGRVRMRFDFDQATGALVRSEAFNADGSTYCLSQFTEFTPQSVRLPARIIPDTAPVDVVAGPAKGDASGLPDALEGFARVDVYDGPDGTVVGYYTDGVFSFTVFEADGPIDIPELRDAPEVVVSGDQYRRAFGAGQVIYLWEVRRGGYALIGDLPLDLQVAVLDELPDPYTPNLLQRVWSNIFG